MAAVRAPLAALAAALLLAACGHPQQPRQPTGALPGGGRTGAPAIRKTIPTCRRCRRPAPARGGYYQDDGPGEHPPANLRGCPTPR